MIVNSQPVVRETVVREKVKYVYRDRPQPKPEPPREVKKLTAPVLIQGYIWVYPEDLGCFSYLPTSVIENINKQGKYGRDDWRVPTYEELVLMGKEADRLNFIDNHYAYAYIFPSKNFSSGELRLISTGQSIAEREEAAIAEKKKKEEELRQATLHQQEAESARERQLKEEQQSEMRSGQAFVQGNIMWQARNKDAKRDTDPGVVTSDTTIPEGWRIPTSREFRRLINNSVETASGYRYGQYIIPYGTYIVNDNGTIKTYNVKLDMLLDGKSGLVRAVKELL